MTEKLDGLLLNNRNRLKDLFLKLTPTRDGYIALNELTKFLKNVRIYPDLISAPDLNKLLKRLSTASQISYTKFELIMKLIAEQSFNPLAPTLERIKMFIIHIRNYVKMHYQISLSINPAKKLLIETQEIRQDHKSTSPTRTKNNSYKTLSRTSSISKGKISEVLQNNWVQPKKKIPSRKESPAVPHSGLLFSQKINKLSSLNSTQNNEIVSERRKHQRSSSSAVINSKNIERKIAESFKNFKQKHLKLVKRKVDSVEIVKRHDKYIASVRRSMFGAGFIKAVIFNAWRAVFKKNAKKDVVVFDF